MRERIKPVAFWKVNRDLYADSDDLPQRLRRVVVESYYREFPVPVEQVLIPGDPVRASTGRQWLLGAAEVAEVVPGWPLERQEGQYKATNYACLVEVFEDVGDDGHTEWCRVGYAIMTPDDALRYMKEGAHRIEVERQEN